MSKIYASTTVPYTTARFFGINRTSKDGLHWQVQVLEREYANVKAGDDDFMKDNNGFSFIVSPENLNKEFDVLGFFDMQPTGQKATMGQVFALVQSLYLAQAAERDVALELPVAPADPVDNP